MRSVKQSATYRVIRSQRPYTSARERWKERMDKDRSSSQQSAALRRNPVEPVPVQQQQREESCREDISEEREGANECAPLRSSSDERGDSSNDDSYIRERLNQGSSRSCNDEDGRADGDGGNGGARVSLMNLLKATTTGTTGRNPLAGQGNGDVNGVDTRFQALSVLQQQERRRAQKALKQEKSVATRRRVLMNILGMKRFYKTLSLVREVKGIREKLLLQCAIPTASQPKKVVVCKVKFDSLPRSARDLMARTHLVAAIEQTEVERLQKLPWEDLILQAHKNIMAYREWMSISETRE